MNIANPFLVSVCGSKTACAKFLKWITIIFRNDLHRHKRRDSPMYVTLYESTFILYEKKKKTLAKKNQLRSG